MNRKPPTTGHAPLDFLFSLQDRAGITSRTLAHDFIVTDTILALMRRGAHKRIVNPIAMKLAARFGYRFALVPLEHPEIEKRPEHETNK